jgi:hypothetical protein
MFTVELEWPTIGSKLERPEEKMKININHKHNLPQLGSNWANLADEDFLYVHELNKLWFIDTNIGFIIQASLEKM